MLRKKGKDNKDITKNLNILPNILKNKNNPLNKEVIDLTNFYNNKKCLHKVKTKINKKIIKEVVIKAEEEAKVIINVDLFP
jgi:hypothetical protein